MKLFKKNQKLQDFLKVDKEGLEMIKKLFFGFLILASTHLIALSDIQKYKIRIAYEIGKTIKAKDGITFENTLPSIMGQESSWGIINIGDKFDETGRLKSLYDSSLGNFQIKLSTAKLTILKYPNLRKKYGHMVNKDKSTYKDYQKHYKKLKYYKKIIQSKKLNTKFERGDKQAIKTIKWAKKEFLYHHKFYTKYQKQARKDTLLINALMYDFKTQAEIAGHYLLSMYEESSRKFRKKEAYWKAVGRYNGGWNNKTYHKNVMKRMKTTKKIIKKIKK
jgi:hypothetical protein